MLKPTNTPGLPAGDYPHTQVSPPGTSHTHRGPSHTNKCVLCYYFPKGTTFEDLAMMDSAQFSEIVNLSKHCFNKSQHTC
jgi:hypothetical protein